MGVLAVVGSAITGFITMTDRVILGLIVIAAGVVSALPWFTLANLLQRVSDLEQITLRSTPPTVTPPETPASGSLKDALDW